MKIIEGGSPLAACDFRHRKTARTFCVDGHLEVTASDAEKRSFGPGGCLLMEDVHGKGHRSHVRPGHDCVIGVIAIHLKVAQG